MEGDAGVHDEKVLSRHSNSTAQLLSFLQGQYNP
jgi:hypothetical protein